MSEDDAAHPLIYPAFDDLLLVFADGDGQTLRRCSLWDAIEFDMPTLEGESARRVASSLTRLAQRVEKFAQEVEE